MEYRVLRLPELKLVKETRERNARFQKRKNRTNLCDIADLFGMDDNTQDKFCCNSKRVNRDEFVSSLLEYVVSSKISMKNNKSKNSMVALFSGELAVYQTHRKLIEA